MSEVTVIEARGSDGELLASLSLGKGTVAFSLEDGRRGTLAPHFEVAGVGVAMPASPAERYVEVIDSIADAFAAAGDVAVGR